MGLYDDITPEELRAELLRFADMIQRMDREQLLLRASPRILKALGELRQMLFAFEIRGALHLGDKHGPESSAAHGGDPATSLDLDSPRIVREALEREWELPGELERHPLEPEEGTD